MSYFSHFDFLPDSDVEKLPGVARVPGGGAFDPRDQWLKGRTTTDDQRRIALRAWFRARYWDPANDTPYDGGYVWIYGGPYSPLEELEDRFTGVINDVLIQEIAQEFIDEIGDEWAPIDHRSFYDEDYPIEISSIETPFSRLTNRLSDVLGVLQLSGEQGSLLMARQLGFAASISAFESYLWETMAHWVENDDTVVKELITLLPAFSEIKIPLKEIFEQHAKVRDIVKDFMRRLVWHRWEQVAPLLKIGLKLQLPGLKIFASSLNKRHDIVHRSGHDHDGNATIIEEAEFFDLCLNIHMFAYEIEEQLKQRSTPVNKPLPFAVKIRLGENLNAPEASDF